jgi:hypothetical protein
MADITYTVGKNHFPAPGFGIVVKVVGSVALP